MLSSLSSCDDDAAWSCEPRSCADEWSCDPSSCEPRSYGAWSSCDDLWSSARRSSAYARVCEPRSSYDRCSCEQSTSSCASTSSPVTYAPWTSAQSTYGRKTYAQPSCGGLPFSSVRRSSSQPTPAPPLSRGRDLLISSPLTYSHAP